VWIWVYTPQGARNVPEEIQKQQIPPGQLTIHADRGSSMTSKTVALLLSDLGVTKSHSRPYVSNDNPFSESQFKTLKYQPQFPKQFGSIEDARTFAQSFFSWYKKSKTGFNSIGEMPLECNIYPVSIRG